jgi:hypothetical protein
MAKKSEGRFKKDKLGIPDPLHFEIGHHHKRLLELIYVVAIFGAILSIVLLNLRGVLTSEERNASTMVVMFFSIILAALLIEKSMVEHRAVSKASKA